MDFIMSIIDNNHKLDRILESTNLDEYELIRAVDLLWKGGAATKSCLSLVGVANAQLHVTPV